jgi:sugar-specific transcriptional regulator TrmB
MNSRKADHLKSALRTGLSSKAAGVYIAALEAGQPLSPKSLILRSNLHRQYVYDALYELEEKGLVVRVGDGRKVKYQAASPDRLLQDAEKRRIETLAGVQSLMRLYDRSPAGIVEVVRGSEACIESEFSLLADAKNNDFLDIIGGAGMKFVDLFGDRIPEWEALRKEKNIKLRYIGSGKDVLHNQEESLIENESRTISGIGDIVNVSIRPNSVSFNIYEPEIMTVHVRNAAAAKSQRTAFEVLWTAAK